MICSREHLLGYLLGALEPAEMAAVERELENDPRLRKDLAAIEAALYPLGFPEREDDASQAEPPASLVARTCEFVDDSKADLVSRPMPAKVVAAAMSDSAPTGKQRLRWADVIMTASVCLAAVSLLFPAIWTVRQQQQVTLCQNNLQHVGISLATYAGQSSDGRIPLIALSGNRSFAGFYAASLLDKELLEETRWLVCPSSDMAEQIESFRVPSIPEIDRAAGEALVRLQRNAGGSYGYNLGFFEDGEYQAARYESRAYYCLMSDAPATFKPTRTTKNHGGRGQNMLYEDGSCRWVVDPCQDLCDDPYLNRAGFVGAGNDCTDVVVGESLATPKPAIFFWRP
jgi:hypothetical protein